AHAYVQPEGTPVSVPISIDSRCSGYQHYALLSRDVELGRLVGLTAEFTQEDDLYTTIGRACDVDRATAKLIVGVVLYGAGPESNLSELIERTGKTPTEARSLAMRLNHATWRTVGKPAKRIYKSLRERAGQGVMRWQTADGFNVTQDYRVTREVSYTVNLTQGRRETFKFIEREPTEVLDIERKYHYVPPGSPFATELRTRPGEQVKAVAPNFIHAADATLLRLAVLHGAKLGVRQWAVAHDAFGAHPNYGSTLARAPREAARQMYDRDTVSRLLGWDAGELQAEFTLTFITDEAG
ncbi:MAG: DNA-directed RNA polymerase, partial [Steroidobacteraceae bacterium]